jgi:hypothetical protein
MILSARGENERRPLRMVVVVVEIEAALAESRFRPAK